jgi:hypothetical protein
MEGFICTYNPAKGVGQIFSERERFWFHRDRIVKGPLNPEINDRVIFEVLDRPVQPGKLPIAHSIIILDLTAGVDGLASPNQNGGEVKS